MYNALNTFPKKIIHQSGDMHEIMPVNSFAEIIAARHNHSKSLPLIIGTLCFLLFYFCSALPLKAQTQAISESKSLTPVAGKRQEKLSNLSREEIYERVFHVPMPTVTTQRLWVMAVVNGKFCCKIEMDWNGEPTGGKFDWVPVLNVLEPLLKPDVYKLLSDPPQPGFMDTARFHAVGIETEVDPANFRFFIRVPPKLLSNVARSLRGKSLDPELAGGRTPATFSAFINWSAQQEYNDTFEANSYKRGPLGVGMDGALQLKGWVLEGASYYNENNEDAFTRKDVRLIKDWVPKALRFSAGDLRYPVSSYQGVMNLGGVGVSRDYSLRPHETTYSTGEYSFYLENPATVEIWINGVLRQTLEMEAGDQDLRDFPFATGENEVELRIRDTAGRQQVLNFSFVYEETLLAKGKDQFSFNIGVAHNTIGNEHEYDSSDPGISLSYRRGLTDHLMVGGFLQAKTEHAVIGCEAATALGIGTLSIQTAASTLNNHGEDWTGRLSYGSFNRNYEWLKNFGWRAYIEYKGKYFSPINWTNTLNKQKLQFSLATNFKVSEKVSINLGGGWNFLRDLPISEAYHANGSLSYYFTKSINASLSATHSKDVQGKASNSVYLGLTFALPDNKTRLSTSKTWDGGMNARADFRSGTIGNSSSATGYISAGRNDYSEQLEAGAIYTSNLGRASVTQQVTDSRRYDTETKNRTLLALQSSIVFADGNFGISRPIRDSFILAKGVENCQGKKILINPALNSAGAESLLFMPAVLPDITSYRLQNVICQPENPPLTYVPQDDRTLLFPSYKSGTVIYVGTAAQFQVLGRLVDEDGNPIKDLPCEISFPNAKGSSAEMTFTDSLGRFLVMAPGPGPCLIKPLSSDSNYAPVTFEIPAQDGEMYRAGDILMPFTENGVLRVRAMGKK